MLAQIIISVGQKLSFVENEGYDGGWSYDPVW